MASARVARPDLVLAVHHRRREGETSFAYTLLAARPGGDWDEERFEPLVLARPEPFAYLEALFQSIQDLPLRDDGTRAQAAERLRGIGATLARDLVPRELLDRLAARGRPGRGAGAPSLHLLSDEAWIPWELLWLAGPAGERGFFLAEGFALARGLHGRPGARALPLTRVAVVQPGSASLEQARAAGRALLGDGPAEVEAVPAHPGPLLDSLASGRFDGWHFDAHGEARGDNPDLWAVLLEPGERLTRYDLEGRARGLGGRRPLVYLSACHGARAAYSLTGVGGLARAFLDAGAGAFVGAHWAILAPQTTAFARTFYRHFLGGLPVAEALRQTRLEFRADHPGDPTWLAFALFADPLAEPTAREEAVPSLPGFVPPEATPFLAIPQRRWRLDLSPPGALLRAEYAVVPFHGRKQELADLQSWCELDRPVQVRLYTGPGGMGKTRLALELCRRLRDRGWVAGLVSETADASALAAAEALSGAGRPLLLVFDYAETRRELLIAVLGSLLERPGPGRLRVILLARRREDWWDQLKSSPREVGSLLAGPGTAHHTLPPLASSTANRADTFHKAAAAFAETLARPAPEQLPDDLDADYFKPVLLLHMSALAAVEGVRLEGEDGILDWILDRERRFWTRQLRARDLPVRLLAGVGQAMAAVTLTGGLPSERSAVELLESLGFFGGQTRDVLAAVARLLGDVYPAGKGVAPVEPDLLGEHLVERELDDEAVREEVFKLIFDLPDG